jgi:hypothetical protein
VLLSLLSKAKLEPASGASSLVTPPLTATIRTEHHPLAPLHEDSAEYRAIISLVAPEGTRMLTAAPGISLKLVELLVEASSDLAILTCSIGPPFAVESTAKAVTLANTSTVAIDATSSRVRLTFFSFLAYSPLTLFVPNSLLPKVPPFPQRFHPASTILSTSVAIIEQPAMNLQ